MRNCWRHGLLLLAATGLLTPLATAQHVSASEGSDGCNTGRPVSVDGGSFPYYRWNGWVYDGGSTQIGGATASINTYSPYVPSAQADNVSAWTMLEDGNPWHYAQVGYAEWPYNGSGG